MTLTLRLPPQQIGPRAHLDGEGDEHRPKSSTDQACVCGWTGLEWDQHLMDVRPNG